jgi:hypothetical protein
LSELLNQFQIKEVSIVWLRALGREMSGNRTAFVQHLLGKEYLSEGNFISVPASATGELDRNGTKNIHDCFT